MFNHIVSQRVCQYNLCVNLINVRGTILLLLTFGMKLLNSDLGFLFSRAFFSVSSMLATSVLWGRKPPNMAVEDDVIIRFHGFDFRHSISQ